ncbi:MAG: hypothetical protein PHH21_00875 [Candidatus Pacebacteria bacterium]|nr:hypothetical protein [Candidatus Paceibacterota bacterium]
MTVIVKRSERVDRILREVERFVPLESAIGIKMNRLLVKTGEKSFDGVTGTILFGKGNTVEKLLFLFGSTAVNVVPYRDGQLEVCTS